MKKKYKNITFRALFEARAETAQFMYDGIITDRGTYQVDNIRVYDAKDGREYLVHADEWPVVDNLVLEHWIQNGPDLASEIGTA